MFYNLRELCAICLTPWDYETIDFVSTFIDEQKLEKINTEFHNKIKHNSLVKQCCLEQNSRLFKYRYVNFKQETKIMEREATKDAKIWLSDELDYELTETQKDTAYILIFKTKEIQTRFSHIWERIEDYMVKASYCSRSQTPDSYSIKKSEIQKIANFCKSPEAKEIADRFIQTQQKNKEQSRINELRETLNPTRLSDDSSAMFAVIIIFILIIGFINL